MARASLRLCTAVMLSIERYLHRGHVPAATEPQAHNSRGSYPSDLHARTCLGSTCQPWVFWPRQRARAGRSRGIIPMPQLFFILLSTEWSFHQRHVPVMPAESFRKQTGILIGDKRQRWRENRSDGSVGRHVPIPSAVRNNTPAQV